ncbi:MAG: hypothetical protein ACXVR9_09715, partial [Gaiellaceae bacterium]
RSISRVESLPRGVGRDGEVADIAPMEPRLPADLHGEQLTAYREGYDVASLWASETYDGAAFEASSLRADLQPAFFRGYHDRLAEIAANEQAS